MTDECPFCGFEWEGEEESCPQCGRRRPAYPLEQRFRREGLFFPAAGGGLLLLAWTTTGRVAVGVTVLFLLAAGGCFTAWPAFFYRRGYRAACPICGRQMFYPVGTPGMFCPHCRSRVVLTGAELIAIHVETAEEMEPAGTRQKFKRPVPGRKKAATGGLSRLPEVAEKET